jgi:hypothetical protein
MSRYLLVEVENPAEAEQLMEAINDSPQYKSSLVVGMFTKATELCKCKPWNERHPGEPERSMHGPASGHYGWWVCTDCRLPKEGQPQSLYNLLDGGDMRGGGWRGRMKGDRLFRTLRYLSTGITVRWVQVGDRVTTLTRTCAQALPGLELEEGSGE